MTRPRRKKGIYRNAQDRLQAHEVKIQRYGQEIQQNIEKHDKKIQNHLRAKDAKIQQDVMDIIAERIQKVYEVQRIEVTVRVVSGDTINEQDYFTRLIPLKEVPKKLIEISGTFNGAYVYVERKHIAKFEAS
ncbi:hypothetical protein BZA77DRAFT_353426 [Pyronema omphalodes]|nr:hypothetical protein BZA77DRAFT_353426 [Pyronema omphalodes]